MNKQLMAILIMDIPAIIFASAACYMAINNIDGFGWFIFAASICCVHHVNLGEDKKMKHEIEIPDLPDGWEAVSVKLIELESSDSEHAIYASKVLAKKKQPRRIIFEETEEGTDNRHNHTIYVKGITIDIYSNKLWKIVEDNKCAE